MCSTTKSTAWIRGGRLARDVARELLEASIDVFTSRCAIVGEAIYAAHERNARMRVPGDPDDWHTAALALTAETAIWTLDQKHFFGCGIPVWSTTILRAVLTGNRERNEPERSATPG
jgi:predicted nucleic acid-binding protein